MSQEETLNLLTLCQHPYGVIKRHCLDIERGKDGLLIRQGGVIIGGDLGGEDGIIMLGSQSH